MSTLIDQEECPKCQKTAITCFDSNTLQFSITCTVCGFEQTDAPDINWDKFNFIHKNKARLIAEDKIEYLAALLYLVPAPREQLKEQVLNILSWYKGHLPYCIRRDNRNKEIILTEVSEGYGTFVTENRETGIRIYNSLPQDEEERQDMISSLIIERRLSPNLNISITFPNINREMVSV
jgi:hypothetical protein